MKDRIHEKVLFAFDPGVNKELEGLKTSGEIDNLEISLSNKRIVHTDDLLKRGPLVLVFIRGTWCPFCRLHLGKLRKWAEDLKGKNATILVVSTESSEVVTEWLKKNPVNYLFASDADFKLSQYFGVQLDGNEFSQAVTFLIKRDGTVKLAYGGKRDSISYSQVMEQVE